MSKLDVNELLNAARQRTGLSDFGPDDFREALEVLVDGINEEVRIDRPDELRERFLRLLTNRLWFAQDLKDHPDILDEDVGSPIVISSLPRTASTKLHRMLGASGDFRVTPMWQTHMFARIPGEPLGGRERRIAETQEYEAWQYRVSPGLLIGHPMFTHEPEEDKDLGEFTFRHTTLLGMFSSVRYAQWVMQADMTPMYDYLLKQLKYLQWQAKEWGDSARKPWLLKTPCHFGYESHLQRIFDKPRFIVTHRDPVKCIPSISTASLAARKLYSDENTATNVGASVSALFSHCARVHLDWRERNPQTQILDLAFADINRDGMQVARKVYDFFGLSLTPRAEAGMQGWEEQNRRDRHAPAHYSSEMIGMIDEQIRAAFEPYNQRFASLL